jgi:hypothetical protein
LRRADGRVEQPGIAGFGGEQDQLTDGDDAAVVVGGAALNIANFKYVWLGFLDIEIRLVE